ncbi:MAG TPA: 16S rRNA (cytidine(1402)-2'-O)-methyltransferase [Acidimicrobiales bacterium]|nr:16S rRNA (cytidine(1402)-2'-O)-methyltransferase [Acidimicrobiales bacterium]
MTRAGRLVLVGTPIGNLGDLSPRAVEALTRADVVACEDTRRTGRLLAAAGIPRRDLAVVNDHTEARAAQQLVDRARAGDTVALVTDAGMPGVSDPGEDVVAAFVAADLPVEVVPGPTAATTALAASGLPTGRFVFEGFLPRKGSARAERLAVVAAEARTVVLYEAPHRAERTLADLREACGPERPVTIGRELTKLHEEWFRGDLAGACEWLASEPKGEFVIVLGGAEPPAEATDAELRAALDAELAGGASTRDAVTAVVARYGVPKRRVYDLAH